MPLTAAPVRAAFGVVSMDIVFNLLLFIHLVALGIAATTPVVMPLLARTLMAGGPEGRTMFGALAKRVGANSQIGFGVLVVTGIAMLLLRYGGAEGQSPWFHAKMTLIVLMVVVMIAARFGKLNPQVQVWTMRGLLLGVIFCAVMAFN